MFRRSSTPPVGAVGKPCACGNSLPALHRIKTGIPKALSWHDPDLFVCSACLSLERATEGRLTHQEATAEAVGVEVAWKAAGRPLWTPPGLALEAVTLRLHPGVAVSVDVARDPVLLVHYDRAHLPSGTAPLPDLESTLAVARALIREHDLATRKEIAA